MEPVRFDTLLDEILGTRSHVRVLRALAQAPSDLNVSGRELARRAGVSHPRTSEILADLTEWQIVVARRQITYALYELNKSHALASPLLRLFDAEAGIGDDLMTFLAQRVARSHRHVRAAVLFGDTDTAPNLAVLTAPGRELDVEIGLAGLKDAVRRRYGCELELVVMGRRQALELVRQGNPTWTRIAETHVPVFRMFPRVR
jgi:DNA-binding transcriptional ArsR family regulator